MFAHKIVVFASEDWGLFALLHSSIHDTWARKQASTLETRLSYTPSDVFDTLPRPPAIPDQLAALGRSYFQTRAAWMAQSGKGLTICYNNFHDSDLSDPILRDLRILHRELDTQIVIAYGWGDISLDHDFREVPHLSESDRIRYTISEEARLELLRRLSRLNRERCEEEQQQAEAERLAQSSDGTTRVRRGRKPKLGINQGGLFES